MCTLNLRPVKGVDYHKATAGRPNYIPELGIYAGQMFAAGNHKLDKSMLIFDLLAVSTCPRCQTCKDTCYALKAQRQYPATYNSRAIKTWLARHKLVQLKALLEMELEHTTKKIVRIHSSGDFFSQNYLNMWVEIARKFPKIKFYSYTKADALLDFSKADALQNLNVVRSMICGHRNYGNEDYIKSLAAEFGAFICSYGIQGRKPAQCGVSCTACLRQKFVVFKEH